MPFTYTKKRDVVNELEKAFEADIQYVITQAETAIKTFTPVQTGHLKGSVEGKKTGRFTGEVKTNVSYAPHVEFGTTRMTPRAMFRKGGAVIKAKGYGMLINVKALFR